MAYQSEQIGVLSSKFHLCPTKKGQNDEKKPHEKKDEEKARLNLSLHRATAEKKNVLPL